MQTGSNRHLSVRLSDKEEGDEMTSLTTDNFAQEAERVIRELRESEGNDRRKGSNSSSSDVTTTQLRNMLAMTVELCADIQNETSDKLNEEIRGQINYLKIRFVYAASKETKVRDFIKKANILKYLDEVGDSRNKFILFSRYMEALVAYHGFL